MRKRINAIMARPVIGFLIAAFFVIALYFGTPAIIAGIFILISENAPQRTVASMPVVSPVPTVDGLVMMTKEDNAIVTACHKRSYLDRVKDIAPLYILDPKDLNKWKGDSWRLVAHKTTKEVFLERCFKGDDTYWIVQYFSIDDVRVTVNDSVNYGCTSQNLGLQLWIPVEDVEAIPSIQNSTMTGQFIMRGTSQFHKCPEIRDGT